MDENGESHIQRKALSINLDKWIYGTIAEIGAGQEVARHFFRAGGASGTVAKSMSAYDMTFSDDIYGKSSRYVSRDRVEKMLAHEFELIRQRLDITRGRSSAFFAYANTAATGTNDGSGECHCWMGIRYQLCPGGEVNDIIMHVRMLDWEPEDQRSVIGVLGVNMIYAAYHHHEDTQVFMQSLTDGLGHGSVEVEILQFFGETMKAVDNRKVGLELVQNGLTPAAFFDTEGIAVPSEALYKKAPLVERGSFHPVTKTNIDMLDCARRLFTAKEEGLRQLDIFEITMKNLVREDGINYDDILARVDAILPLNAVVMVSNLPEYYRLSQYFRRYTSQKMALVLGVNHLLEIFNEQYYTHLDGGILEAFGRLFKTNVKLYIYPMRGERFKAHMGMQKSEADVVKEEKIEADSIVTADNLHVAYHLRNLYKYLSENEYVVPIRDYDPEMLGIYASGAMQSLQSGGDEWQAAVPQACVESITRARDKGYFIATL